MKLLLFITFTAFLSKCSSSNGDTAIATKPVISITSTPVTEGSDVIFTITLSKTSPFATTIDFVTTPNTASIDDYTVTTSTASIPAGQTSITVNIPTNNDSIGELTETFSLTGTVTSNNTSNTLPITIGSRGNGWHQTIGKIDDIGIWNRALTQQEISDLYNGCQLSVNTQPTNQAINVNNNALYTTT